MALPPKQEFPPLLTVPGFYSMSMRDVRKHCVDAFPQSQTRQAIMDGLTAAVRRLVHVEVVGHLWVDGSFMTRKIDPEDTDLLLRISSDFCDNATRDQMEAIRWFTDEDLKSTHHCDSYIWIEYPCDHPAYMESEWWRSCWIRQFGFSRSSQFKGIAVVELPGGAT